MQFASPPVVYMSAPHITSMYSAISFPSNPEEVVIGSLISGSLSITGAGITGSGMGAT